MRATYTKQYLDRGPGVCLAQVHIPRNEEGVIFSGSAEAEPRESNVGFVFKNSCGFQSDSVGLLTF